MLQKKFFFFLSRKRILKTKIAYKKYRNNYIGKIYTIKSMPRGSEPGSVNLFSTNIRQREKKKTRKSKKTVRETEGK